MWISAELEPMTDVMCGVRTIKQWCRAALSHYEPLFPQPPSSMSAPQPQHATLVHILSATSPVPRACPVSPSLPPHLVSPSVAPPKPCTHILSPSPAPQTFKHRRWRKSATCAYTQPARTTWQCPICLSTLKPQMCLTYTHSKYGCQYISVRP